MAKFKIKLFAKAVLNGMLGIFSELILALSLIFAGLIVCLVWWRIFR